MISLIDALIDAGADRSFGWDPARWRFPSRRPPREQATHAVEARTRVRTSSVRVCPATTSLRARTFHRNEWQCRRPAIVNIIRRADSDGVAQFYADGSWWGSVLTDRMERPPSFFAEKRTVMSSLAVQIRDAGPLDVAVEEEEITFEDQVDPGRAIEACLPEPFPTATTRVGCD
ncbi:SflA family class IV lanthipeptide [Streptomyces griseus]|uniref:SflA family class IV lanthipeptide n=2 Tax=Streptomyces TaxID=1883 RepID=UPI00380F8993